MKKNSYFRISISSRTTASFAVVIAFVLPSLVLPQLVQAQNSQSSLTPTPTIVWPAIKALSAYIYDPIGNKVLYIKDADTPRPLASLAKIMTAAIADNILRISQSIALKPVKIVVGKDLNKADKSLKTGGSWTAGDLIKYMLIGSSNKAAETLASEMIPRSSFISLMNFEARRFGLLHTSFNNPSGLNTSTTIKRKVVESPGATSTAREFATLIWKVVEEHPGLLEVTQLQSGYFTSGTDILAVENTNKLLKDLPIVVGKTGFTDLAGGNLAVILQKTPKSHAYVIVVLGSTEEDRFADVAALASTTLQLAGEK